MRPLNWSIKTKFVLVATVIVAFSTLLWGGWVWQNEKRLLTEHLAAEGRLLLSSFSTPLINVMIYEEVGIIEEGGLLDNFIEEIMSNHELSVVYAFVTDQKGRILAHNRYTEFGEVYTDPLTLACIQSSTPLQRPATYGQGRIPILDMGMPLRIHGKTWGALRIGISRVPLERALSDLGTRIALVSGAFFIGGTILFYLVGLTLARPLVKLATAMKGVSPESGDKTDPGIHGDEIVLLEQSFNEMIERLTRAEQEKARAVGYLVQNEKMATVGKLVAGVAHEINNPLAVIASSLYIIDKKLPDAGRTQVDTMRNAMERIEVIVRQLLDLSRSANLEMVEIGSVEFFREIGSFARMALRKHKVVLSTHDDALPFTLRIDKGRLHQVCLNLIMNAADASPPGETIECRAYREKGSYCIDVKNSGEPIPEENLEKVFEIFFTTKPPGKGTGIGLAVCKTIVEMHGGEIVVTSGAEETMFTIRIPAEEKRAESKASDRRG